MHMKNTAPGKDNIKSNTLKNLSPETHAFILEQLNTCLKNHIIPDTWKHGILIPIPKSELDNTRIQNYRPITLLPVLSKVFERIIKNRLEKLVGPHIPAYQFGFKLKHSTMHPRFVLTNNIQTTHLDDGRTACLFMDINKAFDSVWHAGLLYKLHKLNTPKHLLYTIKNLLQNRQLQVRIDSD